MALVIIGVSEIRAALFITLVPVPKTVVWNGDNQIRYIKLLGTFGTHHTEIVLISRHGATIMLHFENISIHQFGVEVFYHLTTTHSHRTILFKHAIEWGKFTNCLTIILVNPHTSTPFRHEE